MSTSSSQFMAFLPADIAAPCPARRCAEGNPRVVLVGSRWPCPTSACLVASSVASCMLVCLDSVYTLEIIARTLREVVNRERLCGTSAFYFSGFRNL